jgi:hypothetical protein
MKKPKKQGRLDFAQLAKAVVDAATDEGPPPVDDGKDKAAVELGRKGGLKGGKARAAKLSKKRRSEIARKAVKTRWKKSRSRKSRK